MKELIKNTMKLLSINLQLFTTATNVTTSASVGNDLSAEMKTFYSDYLIDQATPMLIHDQFGQKVPIPKNGGKTIEFRKYSPLAKALVPIQEGVTPDGKALNVSTITSTIAQYGDWIQLPDMLLLTAIDNNMIQATELLGDQAGRTLDTVTREVLNGGTSVQYSGGVKTSRYALDKTDDKMTVNVVHRGVRFLKTMLAKPIDGYYVAIVHPDVAFDLMTSEGWVDAHKYAQPDNIYEGELGKIGKCKFIESTEAKIFHAENLTAAARSLTVKTEISSANATIAVKELITAADATALVGRKVLIGGVQKQVLSASAAAAGSATITLTSTITVAADVVIYPGEAASAGLDIYSTLFLGANAYGVTEIEGGGLEHIVNQLGSAGAADPLKQRASVAWKATKTAERLVETYMLRVETCSTFDSGAN